LWQPSWSPATIGSALARPVTIAAALTLKSTLFTLPNSKKAATPRKPAEFAPRFQWKNDPEQATLLKLVD